MNKEGNYKLLEKLELIVIGKVKKRLMYKRNNTDSSEKEGKNC